VVNCGKTIQLNSDGSTPKPNVPIDLIQTEAGTTGILNTSPQTPGCSSVIRSQIIEDAPQFLSMTDIVAGLTGENNSIQLN